MECEKTPLIVPIWLKGAFPSFSPFFRPRFARLPSFVLSRCYLPHLPLTPPTHHLVTDSHSTAQASSKSSTSPENTPTTSQIAARP